MAEKTRRAIWKFTKGVQDDIEFEAPHPARVRDILMSPTSPNMFDIYVEVDPNNAEMEKVRLMVRGTGHLFDVLRPDSYDTMTFYIKALRDGSFVWHVWEIE